jgi:hypothetical protein
MKYLITNVTLRDSLFVEGIRIPSQQTKSFDSLMKSTLISLSKDSRALIRLIPSVTDINLNLTTVSKPEKQKPAKKTVNTEELAEQVTSDDGVVDDIND